MYLSVQKGLRILRIVTESVSDLHQTSPVLARPPGLEKRTANFKLTLKRNY